MEIEDFLAYGKSIDKKYRDIHLAIYDKEFKDKHYYLSFGCLNSLNIHTSFDEVFIKDHEGCFNLLNIAHLGFYLLNIDPMCMKKEDRQVFYLYSKYICLKNKNERQMDDHDITFSNRDFCYYQECLINIQDQIESFNISNEEI